MIQNLNFLSVSNVSQYKDNLNQNICQPNKLLNVYFTLIFLFERQIKRFKSAIDVINT